MLSENNDITYKIVNALEAMIIIYLFNVRTLHQIDLVK